MPRPRFVLLSLAIFLLAANAVNAVDREKLRRAMHLPEINIVSGYGLNHKGEFASLNGLTPQPEKIAQLEKELTGDVSDAERYSRLADLYFQARQSARGEEARHKAASLFRKQLVQHPEDPACALRLAEALDWWDDLKEAEALVRRVVEKHPNDWHARLVLGQILDCKCWCLVRRNKSAKRANLLEEVLRSLQTAPPSPEQVAQARGYHQEALTCFDRAVALAPREGEPYRRRGASRYSSGMLEYGLRAGKGDKADVSEMLFNRAALPDLRKAVALGKQEYLGLGMVVMMEITIAAWDHSASKTALALSKKPLEFLSEAGKKRVRGYLEALEQGVRSPNRRKAAEAAEVLGWLQYLFLTDPTGAERTLRQSLKLDPSRQTPWELLACLLRDSKRYREQADLSRQRLQQQNSAWNRLLLAKAYEDLHQLDKAEEVVAAGLLREPSSLLLQLAMADLLLMSGDERNVERAGELLSKVRRDELSEPKYENRMANYFFTCGIYLALRGDREEARKWLKELQEHAPSYGKIQEALKALDDRADTAARGPILRTSAPCPPH